MTIPKPPALYGLSRFLPESAYGPKPQNPAPFGLKGQIDADRVRAIADQIVTIFLNSLPSNYVSQVKGPYYVQQFQAAAEELARIQVLLADAYEDSDYDFTRTEVLFQFLATLVFPDSANAGLPEIDGDLTYREFLKRMVALLLQGSTAVTLVQGVEALTDAEVTLLEKSKFLMEPGVLWTLADQFTFEVNVSKTRRTGPTESLTVTRHYHSVTVNALGSGTTTDAVYVAGTGPAHNHSIVDFVVVEGNGTGQGPHTHDLLSDFPDLPVVLQRNVGLVLQALDPAHTLYEYRNLFRESFRDVFADTLVGMDLTSYYYEDFRKDCTGVKSIVSSNGVVGTDRYLFHDPTLSFRSVRVGSEVIVPVVPTPSPTSGLPREHRYRVTAIVPFPYGDDPVARAYTTAPTGLSGYATVSQGSLTDSTQNFALCGPNETFTFTEGPNTGTFPLETLLGLNGGPVGSAAGPCTSVRPAPSYLRVAPRIMTAGTGISYEVTLDRLGVRQPITVTNEDASYQFFSTTGTFDTITTAHGPLVKGWGDTTPATYLDVTVNYDGSPVAVSSVNPYTGTITLTVPIAGFASGAHTVTVTYNWFAAPVEGLSGLNTKGLTLNKWNLRNGRNSTSPVSVPPGGGFQTTRFPMGVTLGRFPRRRPALQLAHRFIAFEKGYTAGLNGPTTLLLNQSPGRVSVPYPVADVAPQNFRYEGDAFPVTPWEPVGNPQGSVNNGFYSLTDSGSDQVAYWKRDFPLPTATTVAMGARIQVLGYQPDGIFTGVGFGFHNNRRLFFVGALAVPNPLTGEVLRHVGILLRPGDTSSISSWTLGPSALGEVQKSTLNTALTPPALETRTVSVPTASLPTLLSAGDKFQIITGNQTGVYTVEDLYQSQRTGKTFIVVSSNFPANPELLGNRDVTIYFETPWDVGLCTWRLYANTRTQTVTAVFGGTSGSTTSVGASTVASPAYLGPDILPEGYGRALWGSIDRIATNITTWDFVRCASMPETSYTASHNRRTAPTSATLVTLHYHTATVDSSGNGLTTSAVYSSGSGPAHTHSLVDYAIQSGNGLGQNPHSHDLLPDDVERGTIIDTTMTTDPENQEWFLSTPFGDSLVSGGSLSLTSTPADEGLGTSYGYGYIDPFLNGKRVSAFDAKLSVQRDTLGVGGATLVLKDTHKEVRLATLRYINKGALGKSIFRTDTITLVGSVPYYLQGWNGIAGNAAFANGPETVLTGNSVDAWSFYRTLTPYHSTDVGRFLEFRLAIEAYTVGGVLSRTGLTFACKFSTRSIFLEFRAGAVTLCTAPGAGAIANVGVAWSDGVARTYRLTHNVVAATVNLHVDGVLGVSVPLASFLVSTLSGSVQVQTDAPAGGSFTANLRGLCYGGTDEGVANLHRTFGLYLGGDEGDINNWALARTDGSTVPNSAPTSVITEMDWSVQCWVRVFLDPTFGAAFIRPDLAPPPGYTGDFATQSMNPSAGWVKVEYARLPRTPTEKFGAVSFGALNPAGSVRSTWDDVRYRLFTNTTLDYRAPQGMVLNRWNVINSGDYLKDTTPEEVVVSSVTTQRVSLRPCHIFADRVFAVRVDGVTLPQNLWRFNKDSQEITLVAGVPSSGYPVNVVFAPAKPVTTTYLQTQPFPESQTFLNEGTPPIQMSQTGSATVSTVSGDDPFFVPAFGPPVGTAVPADPDYFLRDQYLVRIFEDDPDHLYERMEFFQLDNGGQRGRIASYCEGGPGPNGTWGTTEVGLSGDALRDSYAGMGSAGRGHGPGVYRYSLMASGNSFNGGTLGTYSFMDAQGVVAPFSSAPPVTTEAEPPMLYATGPSDDPTVRGTDTGAINRETLFVLRTGVAPGVVTVWTGSSQQQYWG